MGRYDLCGSCFKLAGYAGLLRIIPVQQEKLILPLPASPEIRGGVTINFSPYTEGEMSSEAITERVNFMRKNKQYAAESVVTLFCTKYYEYDQSRW